MKEKPKDGTGFGAKLKKLREASGLTQEQLAERTGMNKFGVAKLEQGVTEPYWPTVLKLAAALGVDCSAFTGGDRGEAPATKKPPAGKTTKPRPRGKQG